MNRRSMTLPSHKKLEAPDWSGFVAPADLYEGAARGGAFTSLVAADGMLINREKLRRGLEVSRVADVDYRHFLPVTASTEEIQKLALRIGNDAAMGFLLRHLLARGGTAGTPAFEAWIKASAKLAGGSND